eukprot:CAMPEP_0181122548 /NCGR_PEP_ID=MMETSP1071-20121207/25375_1 /TAXON_ID=35127 /ORGANISM="Thalassiosira sp., Strain NH16" /LENGTH=279 /DNA_ID=CAMNT_0023207531 /DNA_START=9 /DNA_END=850 /DNA_ORIENTATION=+
MMHDTIRTLPPSPAGFGEDVPPADLSFRTDVDCGARPPSSSSSLGARRVAHASARRAYDAAVSRRARHDDDDVEVVDKGQCADDNEQEARQKKAAPSKINKGGRKKKKNNAAPAKISPCHSGASLGASSSSSLPDAKHTMSQSEAVDEVLNESAELLRAASEAQSLGRLGAARTYLILAHARAVGLGRLLEPGIANDDDDDGSIVGFDDKETADDNTTSLDARKDNVSDALAASARELLSHKRANGKLSSNDDTYAPVVPRTVSKGADLDVRDLLERGI